MGEKVASKVEKYTNSSQISLILEMLPSLQKTPNEILKYRQYSKFSL